MQNWEEGKKTTTVLFDYNIKKCVKQTSTPFEGCCIVQRGVCGVQVKMHHTGWGRSVSQSLLGEATVTAHRERGSLSNTARRSQNKHAPAHAHLAILGEKWSSEIASQWCCCGCREGQLRIRVSSVVLHAHGVAAPAGDAEVHARAE